MNIVANVDEHALTGQDLISIRAETSIQQIWVSYLQNLFDDNFNKLDDNDTFNLIYKNIKDTQNPVFILLGHKDSNQRDTHSVLAYGVNGPSGEILIYDPNLPGENRSIKYNYANNTFDAYSYYWGLGGSYDLIRYCGDGSIRFENYEDIMSDGVPVTINITSPVSGQQVATAQFY